MAVYDLDAFLRLSAVLNYQLSAFELGSGNILALLLEDRTLSSHERETLVGVLKYLDRAFGRKR